VCALAFFPAACLLKLAAAGFNARRENQAPSLCSMKERAAEQESSSTQQRDELLPMLTISDDVHDMPQWTTHHHVFGKSTTALAKQNKSRRKQNNVSTYRSFVHTHTLTLDGAVAAVVLRNGHRTVTPHCMR